MGLFDFLKKKQASDQPILQSFDTQTLNNDLPSIDGSAMSGDMNNVPLPSLDVNGANNSLNNMPSISQRVPQNLSGNPESKSISFTAPTFDFSLPPSDDAPVAEQSKVAGSEYVDVEDLEKLFPSDDWKEPDLTNYAPYSENKIEEPKPEDFTTATSSDLPSFEDNIPPLQARQEVEVKRTGLKPVELYIRGKAYNRVFVELGQISQNLQQSDSKISRYEDLVKAEEPLTLMAKENTEYLYRKLNQIDKKIFT